MDAWTVFNVVAGGTSILSFLCGFYLAKRNVREKKLVYDVSAPLPLVVTAQGLIGPEVKLTYQGNGGTSRSVEGAYLWFVQLANMGRETVLGDDVVPEDPLRVEVSKGSLLHIGLDKVSRQACCFALDAVADDAVRVTFSFLDYGDGAVLRLVTSEPVSSVRLLGSVVGMPSGIINLEAIRSTRFRGFIGIVAAIMIVVALPICILLIPFWLNNLWSGFQLPWVALTVIVICFVLYVKVMARVMGVLNLDILPQQLSLPPWVLETKRLGLFKAIKEITMLGYDKLGAQQVNRIGSKA